MKEHRVYYTEKWVAEENCLDFNDWYEYEDENGTLHPDAEIWIADCEREGCVYSLLGFVERFNEPSMNANEIDIYITNKY